MTPPPPVDIREARQGDLGWIVRLYAAEMDACAEGAGVPEGHPRIPRERFEEAISKSGDFLMLVEAGGMPAGFIMGGRCEEACDLAPAPFGEVEWLGIAPGFNGWGLERTLLHALLERFREMDLPLAMSATYLGQLGFHEALRGEGFRTVARRLSLPL